MEFNVKANTHCRRRDDEKKIAVDAHELVQLAKVQVCISW